MWVGDLQMDQGLEELPALHRMVPGDKWYLCEIGVDSWAAVEKILGCFHHRKA